MVVPHLQDHVREFCYSWFMDKIQPCKILDIGHEKSGLSAWMASLGYDVTACERDATCTDKQLEWQQTFKSKVNLYCGEFLDVKDKFDVILSVFALKHNAYDDNDIKCYKHCAELLNPGGKIFIAHEYQQSGPWIHKGRTDGDMYVYSDQEIQDRLIKPISEVVSVKNIDIQYMSWARQSWWCDKASARAAFIGIEI